MDNIEQEELALENARATMDQWEGILLTVVRELRSDPSPDPAAIERMTARLYAVARDRLALWADDLAAVLIAQRRYASLIAHDRRLQAEPQSQVPETTLRLAEFETAKETLGMLLAARSRWIFEEEAKPHPNAARIGQWTRESEELFHRERAPRFDDTEAIDEVIRQYGPQVRALHEEDGR